MDRETSRRWWQIDLLSDDPDEAGPRLFVLGAEGVEITGPRSLRCFVEGDTRRVDDLVEAARPFAAEEGRTEVASRNWVQECEEVLRPLTIGAITIVPVMSFDAPGPIERRAGEIRIIPGMGFGTGHHATTSSAIDLLQHPLLREDPPYRALDMGTGSGILALAVSELYGSAVDAVDVDPEAIANAAENVRLNESPSLVRGITAVTGSIELASGPYPLIVANIYAEVLRSLESRFHELSEEGGYLILSGIMQSLRGDVLESYSFERWRLVDERLSEGWVSLFFVRRPMLEVAR